MPDDFTYTHDYECTHGPIFGTLIDQRPCCDPGPVTPSTTHPAADWTYRPQPWTPNRHHIGDYPWPTPHPTYPYPAIPAPLQPLIITTTANAAPTAPERPEDVIARACRELADAAARLHASAATLGLGLDKRAIREAIDKKLADALGD